MKFLCRLLIRFYQKFISPLKPHPTCRFTPTCSAYALEAYTHRGFVVASLLTAWRILRCNPLCPAGYDPVPMTGFKTMGWRYKKPKKSEGDSNDNAFDP
ncbi:MAG: membrane protein insertion efficiency factor YidD [Ruminococcaceae bacterium]|nr:membrane protein insertion efficiency factor YidD [Oscillospiraceae bacterium]